jgi:type VI secretion system protein VasD
VVDGSNKLMQAAASKVYEAILQPGEMRSISIKPNSDTRALGVVGAYRGLSDVTWLLDWGLPKERKSWWCGIFGNDAIELNVHFKKTEITIKKMD